MESIDESQNGLVSDSDTKISVFTTQQSSINSRGYYTSFCKKLGEFRAYDTQKYIDMVLGDAESSDEEFQVPSDHLEQT